MRRRLRALGAAAALVLAVGVVTACAAQRRQSIVHPQGEHADAVHGLWIWLLVVGAAVWLIVVALLAMAVVRRRRRAAVDEATAEGSEGRAWSTSGRPVAAVAAAGALIPALIIAGIAGLTVVVQRDVEAAGEDARRHVEVVGHQYWWEVNYPDEGLVSANEIHIPVGERVRIDVSSQDVAHSFWVPELGGKIDMIPGRANSVWFEASEPGVYWGQCAEYCGQQHALMRVVVIAHEPAEYEGWIEARRSTPEPSDAPAPEENEDELVARGREVFLSSSCVYCHTVDGTAAAGEAGPDLTHFASRETIAAGTLPNDAENLSAWILDPQSIKPGSLMPATDIDDPDDLDALLAYLATLE